VDEAALRAEAGFDTQPTDSDIEGTRDNMLEKVLEADKFPFALIGGCRRDTGSATLTVTLTLHGSTRTLQVPAQIETGADRIA